MGVPRDKDAKRFYLAARQRLEDARLLLEHERTTAAVYLAGYCVECMWKALIITQAGKGKKDEVLEQFAGSKAHNYDFLRSLYNQYGGPLPPRKDKDLINALVIVGSWGTHVRYDSGTMPADDAEEFLDAVQRIHTWADSRL